MGSQDANQEGTGKQFSHVYPLIESAKPGTQTTGTIDAKMNRALEGYNKIGQDIAEQQELLIKNKPEGYKQELVKLNAKAKKNVMNAVSDLGKEYKGQIGYFQVDPDTGGVQSVEVLNILKYDVPPVIEMKSTTGVGAVLRPVFGTIPEAKAPTKLVKVIDCIGKL